MRSCYQVAIAITAGVLCLLPAVVHAHSAGPSAGAVGPPLGDRSCSAIGCHAGSGNGKGTVSLSSTNGLTYVPGVKQHMVLTITDPTQQRWGFQASARLASTPTSGAAGDLESSDAFTQVICFDDSPKPAGQACPVSPDYQYVEHTVQGTRNGAVGGMTFEFDWTPPTTGAGDVSFYVGAVAANGDGTEIGDHVYYKTFTVHQANTDAPPSVNSSGVLNAASFTSGIVSGSWVAVQGSNLSQTTRSWTASDFVNGQFPTNLDGVSVTVDSKPAYVAYISPAQINVQMPSDAAAGPVSVVVTTAAGSSPTVMAQLQTAAPAPFTYWAGQISAVSPDGNLIGPSPLGGCAGGQVISLYGTGFGTTTPPVLPGQPASQTAVLTDPVTVTIGGVPAQVLFAGIAAGSAGVYQINVQVPLGLTPGDLPVTIQYQGLKSSQTAYLRVFQ